MNSLRFCVCTARFRAEGGVDHEQYLRGHLVFFTQMAIALNADLVGNTFDTGEPRKRAVRRGLEQGFLHGLGTQT